MGASSEQLLVHIRAVDLDVADGAILELRAEQVMKRGRDSAQRGRILDGPGRGGQVGMALQAQVADFRAGQHAWVGGAVRLMAGGAAFQAHGRVLKSEWAAQVAVAAETAWFVAGGGQRGEREKGR